MMNSLMVNILKCAFIWHNRFQRAFKYMISIYFQTNKPEGRRDMVTESLSSFLRYHGQWMAKPKPTRSFMRPPPPPAQEALELPRWIRLPTPETWVRSLGQEDSLKKEMATHSRILAWEMLWPEEHGGLQSIRSWKSQTWPSDYTTGSIQAYVLFHFSLHHDDL